MARLPEGYNGGFAAPRTPHVSSRLLYIRLLNQFRPYAGIVAVTLFAVGVAAATDVLLIPTMTLALLDELKKNRYDLSTLHSVISSGGRSPWPW